LHIEFCNSFYIAIHDPTCITDPVILVCDLQCTIGKTVLFKCETVFGDIPLRSPL